MKMAFKILVVFALFSAFVPVCEIYEFAAGDLVEHNCCGDSEESRSGNTCNPICHCFGTLTLPNIIPSNLSLEVKFIHYHSDTNKFIEEQTEPVFRPPIA